MPFGINFVKSKKPLPIAPVIEPEKTVQPVVQPGVEASVPNMSEDLFKASNPLLEETKQAIEKPASGVKSPAVIDKPFEPGFEKVAEPFEVESDAKEQPKSAREFMSVGVSSFDDLIDKHGIERGSTILISGGCGTGKSTFCIQSIYNGIVNHGEKAVYLTFEESPEKIKRHMHENYGWDLDKLEKEGKLAILKLNPFKIARSVEASLVQQRKALLIKVEQISLPFMPDRIIVDSLSALSIAFMGNTENYRYYVRHMFEILDHYNSINFVISETEQDPGIYSRAGMEEFLADGVVVLYNIKVGRTRERALEILKLRCSNHVKDIVPYQLTSKGFVIFRGSEVEDQLKQLTELGKSFSGPGLVKQKKKKGG